MRADASRQTLRPILPQDSGLLDELVRGLSPESRRRRFHGAVNLSPTRLQEMANVDFTRRVALVVTTTVGGAERLIADARYVVDADGLGAEFAIMVAAGWQRRGVGAWALRALQDAANRAGLQWLRGDVLNENTPMLGLMQQCGFALSPDPDELGVLRAQRRLGQQRTHLKPVHAGLLSWLRPTWARRSALVAP